MDPRDSGGDMTYHETCKNAGIRETDEASAAICGICFGAFGGLLILIVLYNLIF